MNNNPNIIPTEDSIPKRIPQPMLASDIPADSIDPNEYNQRMNAQIMEEMTERQREIEKRRLENLGRPLAERIPLPKRPKHEQSISKAIILSLISFIIFEIAFELLFSKIINTISSTIFKIGDKIALIDVDKSYITRLGISNVFTTILCYTIVIFISWLVVKDRFRKVFLSIKNQTIYIISVSIMSISLLGLYCWNFIEQLNNQIANVKKLEGFEVVTSLTNCYKTNQIIAIVLFVIAIFISCYLIYKTTKKKNQFVQI